MTEETDYIEVTISSAPYRRRVEMQEWAEDMFGDRVDCRGPRGYTCYIF